MTWDEDIMIIMVLLAKKKRRQALKYLVTRMMQREIERPLVPRVTFTLESNCRLNLRFDDIGVRKLACLLGLPAVIVTNKRYRCNRDEALAIVLYRLSFPRRYLIKYNYQMYHHGIDTMICRYYLEKVLLVSAISSTTPSI